ncbi:acyl-CoA thioesterase [Frigidibacter albus]|uniref:Acyl-CoA thioesterase n=1 Tax=Frigidibacter albus TaxID=1465486 RepID=A0A6L8VM36_9RHOB|nr:thioesterase family protein [Frigidibacter albus]MZQ91144.1 acyl-CoA thioesterase [Frigidibacter albus]NBE33045.1 acyl-CoA thioesterase [Frigidibacter albus]GGH63018.1 thioesterase [Frigidibacter albus]
MRAPPGTRADYVHFRPHTTRWNDNDTYGHLNNVVHYQLFDTTVNEWLIRNGLLDTRSSPAIGLVAETGCRYHGEMTYPQGITAGLKVARLGSSSVRYEMGLFPEDNDAAAAEGFLVHVYVDVQTRRPCPIPEETRAALKGLVKEAG